MKRRTMRGTISRPINVSLRIIADLSQGLYRFPADALKELVSNAYDADSPVVNIDFIKDFSSITVYDRGKGMTLNEFIEVMETIGGTSKREEGAKQTTPSGRKIVGRIGIGLLGASQLATTLEIESSTKDSTTGFRARIEFDQFASREARKIKITQIWEDGKRIEIGRYDVQEIRDVARKAHFTRLVLFNIKPIIQKKLRVDNEKDGQLRMMGTKLHTTRQLIKWMMKNQITKTGLHEYDRIFWELCALCPVPYLPNAIRVYNKIDDSSRTGNFLAFAEFVNKETRLTLKVDGMECFKPIYLPSPSDRHYQLFFNLLFMKGIDNKVVSYYYYDKDNRLLKKRMKIRGYIYFQRPRVWPPELQGLLIRVRHVAVGQYDSTFMTYRRHEGFKFSQITGEILVDDLDEVLNIDRSSFRETESSFEAFRHAIHKYLGMTVFPGIKYQATEERYERHEEEFASEKRLLQKYFKKIDRKRRKINFRQNQPNLVERSDDTVSLALGIDGKKYKYSYEFYQILAFLETHLFGKLPTAQRDELYKKLAAWIKQFK